MVLEYLSGIRMNCKKWQKDQEICDSEQRSEPKKRCCMVVFLKKWWKRTYRCENDVKSEENSIVWYVKNYFYLESEQVEL